MSSRHILVASAFVAATHLTISPARGQDTGPVDGLRHRVDRLEAQLAELQEVVSQLEDPMTPILVAVDCGAGQTVAGALAQGEGKAGPLYITITGMCSEAITITRDNVTLMGAALGAGVRAPAPSDTAISLYGVRRVSLNRLTVDAGDGRAGIVADHGSSFGAIDTTVRGGSVWGVVIGMGSSGFLHRCTIEDGPSFGIAVAGSAELHDCHIRRHSFGVYAEDGGNVFVYASTVKDNQIGVAAFVQGTVRVAESVVEANREFGVSAALNSTIQVRDGSRISGNLGPGAAAYAGTLNIEETVIANNGGSGIELSRASALNVYNSVTISGNSGDGIWIRDLSSGSGGNVRLPDVGPMSIRDNRGWGINCAGPEATKAAQNGFALEQVVFSGNTTGAHNCPVN